MPIFNYSCSADLSAKMAEYCRENGIGRSKLIQRAVEQLITYGSIVEADSNRRRAIRALMDTLDEIESATLAQAETSRALRAQEARAAKELAEIKAALASGAPVRRRLKAGEALSYDDAIAELALGGWERFKPLRGRPETELYIQVDFINPAYLMIDPEQDYRADGGDAGMMVDVAAVEALGLRAYHDQLKLFYRFEPLPPAK